MHRKTKRLSAFILALLLIFSVGLISVAAQESSEEEDWYEIESLYLRVKIPEGFYVFTQDTSIFDANWEKAGIKDPSELLSEYEDRDTLAGFISEGGNYQITVAKTTSDTAQDIYNLSLLSDEEFQSFMDQMTDPASGSENMTASGQKYSHAQVPFLRLDMSYVPEDDTPVYELCLATIINGATATFDTYSHAPLTEEHIAKMLELVDSAEFTHIFQKGETTATFWDYVLYLSPILLIILLVILVVFAFSLFRKGSAKKRDALATRISEYRTEQRKREEENPNAPEPPELFRNTTEHSESAIHIFSGFHSYRKNPFTIPLYLLTAAFVLAVGITVADSESILLTLVCIGVSIAVVVRLCTLSSSANRVLQRSYKVLKTRTAVYSFREDDFRITGIQSGGLYPYFQVTSAYETAQYFYIYLGQENAYYVKKDTFSRGDAKEFRAFLKRKLEGRFHKR